MKRKRQAGQAFILVLIILAIGALVVVPTLRLTTTVLKSSQTITQRNKGLYACEAAQQKIMWMLFYDIDSLVSENLTGDGDSISFTVDVCGTTVYAGITMRAVEMEGGVVLAGEHTIMPTKTVEPDSVADQNDVGPFTYTIALEQVSSNNTQGLDVVYDIMSPQFKGKAEDLYVTNSSYISDDGVHWDWIDDPKTDFNSNELLRWPAEGSFGSPFRDFTPGQVKYLKFQMSGPFNADGIVCNWVVIQVADVFTLSGPQAPLRVMPTTETECTDDAGVFEVGKTCYPTVIPPLQPTDVTYTITITNKDGSTNFVTYIEDYLPPGFTYIGPTTTEMTDPADQGPHQPGLVTLNGVERYKLVWDSVQLGASGCSIGGGDNVTLTFMARAEQGISGSYYNEVVVAPKNYPSPGAFDNIDGFNPVLYSETYSWNSGIVIVPAYDSTTGADGENITSSLALTPDGITIISWHPQ